MPRDILQLRALAGQLRLLFVQLKPLAGQPKPLAGESVASPDIYNMVKEGKELRQLKRADLGILKKNANFAPCVTYLMT